jgi:hypothetical protein
MWAAAAAAEEEEEEEKGVYVIGGKVRGKENTRKTTT